MFTQPTHAPQPSNSKNQNLGVSISERWVLPFLWIQAACLYCVDAFPYVVGASPFLSDAFPYLLGAFPFCVAFPYVLEAFPYFEMRFLFFYTFSENICCMF